MAGEPLDSDGCTRAEPIAGFSWWLLGYSAKDLPARDYDFDKPFEVNLKRGAWPQPPILFGARVAMAFLTILGVALLYRVTKIAGGWIGGIIVLLLFGLSFTTRLNGRRVMEEPALVFLCLALSSP